MGRSFSNPKLESLPLQDPSSLAVSDSPAGTLESGGEATTAVAAMVLLGCTRCLMYVMSSKLDLKCPKCNSTALLDFFHLAEQASQRNAVDMSTKFSSTSK